MRWDFKGGERGGVPHMLGKAVAVGQDGAFQAGC